MRSIKRCLPNPTPSDTFLGSAVLDGPQIHPHPLQLPNDMVSNPRSSLPSSLHTTICLHPARERWLKQRIPCHLGERDTGGRLLPAHEDPPSQESCHPGCPSLFPRPQPTLGDGPPDATLYIGPLFWETQWAAGQGGNILAAGLCLCKSPILCSLGRCMRTGRRWEP